MARVLFETEARHITHPLATIQYCQPNHTTSSISNPATQASCHPSFIHSPPPCVHCYRSWICSKLIGWQSRLSTTMYLAHYFLFVLLGLSIRQWVVVFVDWRLELNLGISECTERKWTVRKVHTQHGTLFINLTCHRDHQHCCFCDEGDNM